MPLTIAGRISSTAALSVFPTTVSPGERLECPCSKCSNGKAFAILCVVTRYFGGILLGAGGLVRAYTKGAKIAVDAAGKSIKRVWTVLYVPCPYSFYERVKLEIDAFGGILRSTEFGAEVDMEILFPEASAQPFLSRLTDLTSGTVEGMEIGQEYRAMPVCKEEAI